MGLTGISEFTFGFAFLHEQTTRHWAGMTAVPILPSLLQEAEDGWDAKLPINGVPNYYQFKLSDYLVRSNAKYFNEKPFYTSPYYRISLHRLNHNQQHRRLRELSKTAPETYYVAPETNDLDEFNNCFVSSRVIDVSRMIPVNQCKDAVDDKQHYITFQRGNTGWYEHSEPLRHEWSVLGQEHESFLHSQRDKAQLLDLAFAEHLWATQSELASKVLSIERFWPADEKRKLIPEPRERTRNEYLRAAADIAMTMFGSTLVVVGESSSSIE